MKLFKGQTPSQDANKSQNVMDDILAELENGENPALLMSEEAHKNSREYRGLDCTVEIFDR